MIIFTAVLVSLQIGSFFLIMEILKDMEHDISSFNRTVKSEKNQFEMGKRLQDTIRFYSNVKQLSVTKYM